MPRDDLVTVVEPLELVVVDAVAVQVAGEERAPVAVGPVVGQVDHRADVRVAAAERLVDPVPLARVLPAPAGPVQVVGAGLHQLVEVRVEVVAVHPIEVGAGDHAEQVGDHAVGDERLAVVVEVQAPRIGGAVGDDLEDLAGRVIPPDAAVHLHSLVFGRAGLADARGRKDTVAAPEPAVGPPLEGIEQVVLGIDVPAVELDDRRSVGPVVAVAVGEEEQVGRRADPDAAGPQLDAGVVRPLVVEDGAAVEAAVAVGVLEDQDAVLAVRPAQPDRIRRVLDDPEPAAGSSVMAIGCTTSGSEAARVTRKPAGSVSPRVASAGEVGAVAGRPFVPGGSSSPGFAPVPARNAAAPMIAAARTIADPGAIRPIQPTLPPVRLLRDVIVPRSPPCAVVVTSARRLRRVDSGDLTGSRARNPSGCLRIAAILY